MIVSTNSFTVHSVYTATFMSTCMAKRLTIAIKLIHMQHMNNDEMIGLGMWGQPPGNGMRIGGQPPGPPSLQQG